MTTEKQNFVLYNDYKKYPVEEMRARARSFYKLLKRRRTVREFSERHVPKEIIEDCIRAAGTAPNGANMQPWHFVVIEDIGVKKKIRAAAEEEEKEFYGRRASEEWLKALAPLGTDEKKPFLEKAPYLIAIFAEKYGLTDEGDKVLNYYVKESVGIATGMLVTAIHNAGLASLTHTPSPMGFLNEILDRPSNESPFLLLVVGYPKENVKVPDITKKPLEEIATFI
ncbi:nitroreductase family protein [Balneolaceae bacterium YR4-1]|uniref:Nitroreductase family protein n=1 Tax=Halalkalibaculum roseum TaxID=2709311 RepID=A0A6M1SZE2_9BACT|nr:nitroreductase family protein [Halalkalibaculum roseum]NGP77738.1 nitroreductase family protein [Halalkalibaculum roseum]